MAPAPWVGPEAVEGYVGSEYRFQGPLGAEARLEYALLSAAAKSEARISVPDRWGGSRIDVAFGSSSDCLVIGHILLTERTDRADALARVRLAATHFGVSRLIGESRRLEIAADFEGAMSRAQAGQALANEYPEVAAARTGNLLSRIASIHWSAGRLEESAAVGQKALVAIPDSQPDARALAANNLGLTYRDLGWHDQAEVVLRTSYERAVRELGQENRNALITLFNLGLVHFDQGDWSKAAPILERAFALQTKALGPNDRATLRTQETVASVYAALGRTDDAVGLSERALAVWQEFYGDGNPLTEFSRMVLAMQLGRAGQNERARQLLQQAHSALDTKLGAAHTYTVRAGLLLSRELLAADLDEQAAPLVEQLLEVTARGGDRRFRAQALQLLAQTRQRQGRTEEALQAIESAIDIYQEIGAESRGADLRRRHAELLDLAGRRPEAMRSLSSAIESIERQRASVGLVEPQRQGLLAERLGVYRQLLAWQVEAGADADAFQTSELLKGRALLDSLASRALFSAAGLDAESRNRLGGFKARLVRIDERLASATEPTERALLDAERNAIERESDAFRATLIAASPRLKALTSLSTIDAQGARAALPSGAMAISYVFGEKHLYAFVVARNLPLRVVRLGDAEQIRSAVRALIALLASDNVSASVWRLPGGGYVVGPTRPDGAARVASWSALADELGRQLIQPFGRELRQRRELFVVPDGALAQLPFEVLTVDRRLLAEQHSVRYVQSLSVLAMMRALPKIAVDQKVEVLSVGAPDYGTSDQGSVSGVRGDREDVSRSVNALALRAFRGGGASAAGQPSARGTWTPLPGALKEVEAVKAAFAKPAGNSGAQRSVLALTGREASEQSLQEMSGSGRLKQFRFLHFAAHGYLNPTLPMLSAVVLAQTDVTDDADGYVTAAEWVGYEINSELIVLSACETGRGKELPGEGVVGLPYAMFVAGNRQAVLTLWRVVDDSAARFTGRFFMKVADGTEPHLALAQTKREFLKEPGSRHPVHWAPFILYGY